jgi:hypothetical protein
MLPGFCSGKRASFRLDASVNTHLRNDQTGSRRMSSLRHRSPANLFIESDTGRHCDGSPEVATPVNLLCMIGSIFS